MKQFAVVGNPIKHSKSPIIHQEFAKQFDIELQYEKLLAPLEEFATTIERFFANDGSGLNVTLPFKEQAFALAKEIAPRAKLAKAANTLYVKDGKLVADNTDGAGLVKDLKFHNVKLTNKRILVIGAGGAARGAIPALLAEQPAKLVIANRTEAKAQAIVDELDVENVDASGLIEITGEFDVVINSTSSSVTGDLPGVSEQVLKGIEVAYDMYYSNEVTSFNQWVTENNSEAKAIDGLGMLVEQAAESFSIWHGKTPDTKEVRKLLR